MKNIYLILLIVIAFSFTNYTNAQGKSKQESMNEQKRRYMDEMMKKKAEPIIITNVSSPHVDVASKYETKNNSEYRISGISTTEDVGGVEIFRSDCDEGNWCKLEFENYNNFSVSVIFEYATMRGNIKTGTIVLKANEKKKTNDTYPFPTDFKLIARKLSN